jgi:prolyl-tRNA editing enzyme YbaK/EbsC (Cys-tRNA(Pro) deacylase)
MSLETVRAHLLAEAPDIEIVEIVELDRASATMTLSAAWGIEPAQIAKTLALRVRDQSVLVVTCGDSRLDNKKAKAALGGKPKMLAPQEATALTGHVVGGVCPFGLASPLPVYLDLQLKRYGEVVPGAGEPRYAFRVEPERMAELVGGMWADLCQPAAVGRR